MVGKPLIIAEEVSIPFAVVFRKPLREAPDLSFCCIVLLVLEVDLIKNVGLDHLLRNTDWFEFGNQQVHNTPSCEIRKTADDEHDVIARFDLPESLVMIEQLTG